MVSNLHVHKRGVIPLVAFLEDNDFLVEEVTDSVLKAAHFNELPVFIHFKNDSLYFEVDLGSTKGLASQELYEKLLDVNTEILPVSVGINTAAPDDPHLVLIESRESSNLDENEILSVFNALEIATDKIEKILAEFVG
jgi:hypothetical protein